MYNRYNDYKLSSEFIPTYLLDKPRIVEYNTSMKTIVFVYGSLKRGFPLHGWLSRSKYLGTVTLHGFTLHSAGAFPYMVPCELGGVQGELYEVTKKTLNDLDRIEQEGTLYKREVIGTFERQDVHSYLAKNVQDTGFSSWNGQDVQDDLSLLALE